MARQTLTFLVIMFGAMLLLRGGCSKNEEVPAAESLERAYVPPPEDRVTLRDEESDLTATFDPSGMLISVTRGSEEIVRPAARSRGTFHLLFTTKQDRKRALAAEHWSHTELPGGVEFTYSDGDLKITKRILLAAEGAGLDFQIKASGVPEEVRGLELSGASGVAMAPAEGTTGAHGTAFWKLAREELWTRSLDELRDEQEARRRTHAALVKDGAAPAASLDVSRRRKLDGEAVVERFGLLGANHYLAIEDLAGTDALNLVSYRVDRAGTETREVETWMSLLIIQGTYEGDFPLRWTPRAEAATRLDALSVLVTSRAEERLTLENDTLRLELADQGAAVTGLWLKEFAGEAGVTPVEGSWIPMLGAGVRRADRPLTLSVDDPDQVGGNPAALRWTVTHSDTQSITFHLETERAFRFEKTITLPAEGQYDVGVKIRIVRPAGSTVEHAKFRLVGPAGSYIADAYRGIIGAEPPEGFLLERRGGDDDEETLDSLAKSGDALAHRYGDGSRHLLRAVGVRGAYFICALVTEERLDRDGRPLGEVAEAAVRVIDLEEPQPRPDGEMLRQSLLGSFAAEVPFDAGVAEARYSLFAGPADLELLRPLRIEESIDFGFFGAIGRFLMWLMKLLESMVQSYGLAIILMTFIVRAVLLPISYKTQLSMQRYGKRMQKLKPILEEVQAKHAKNPKKLNEERMRVMREHKVGFPLGCLTMFLQIPIWFALFGALRVEFSLRHAPFLWATDLSMPDRLASIPFWPHWLNFLPVLMLVLWVMQQKVTPTPNSEDPQVQAQMKIVRYMPYIFFFMLYKYAAALSVYMCVSSAWGIIEGKMVRKAIQAQP